MTKRTLGLIAFLLTTAILIVSATAAPESEAAKEALRKGSYSLQFSVNQNATIGSYEGSMISLKRHSSAKTAYRAGLDFGTKSINDKDKRTASEADQTDFAATLSLEYLKYFRPTKRLTPYIGGGPNLGYNYSRYKVLTPSAPQPINKNTSWNMGVALILGAEWFATSGISLFAEYSAGATYASAKVTQRDNLHGVVGQRESTMLTFKGRGARLGLSIYL